MKICTIMLQHEFYTLKKFPENFNKNPDVKFLLCEKISWGSATEWFFLIEKIFRGLIAQITPNMTLQMKN